MFVPREPLRALLQVDAEIGRQPSAHPVPGANATETALSHAWLGAAPRGDPRYRASPTGQRPEPHPRQPRAQRVGLRQTPSHVSAPWFAPARPSAKAQDAATQNQAASRR
jgi:hypothetical protein